MVIFIILQTYNHWWITVPSIPLGIWPLHAFAQLYFYEEKKDNIVEEQYMNTST